MAGIKLKQLGFAMASSALFAAGAVAQSGGLSMPPALPPVPSAPAAPSPSNTSQVALVSPTTPSIPTAPKASSPASPGDSVIPKLEYKGSATPSPNAVLRSPPANPEQSQATFANMPAPTSPAVTAALEKMQPIKGTSGLPDLPDPAAPTPAFTSTLPQVDESMELPRIIVEREQSEKTWESKLAPTATPPRLGYNYKRQILPDAIYRTEYDRDNQHLPRRVERLDYIALLFGAVTRNDVEAARSLINAGTSISAVNAYGETPYTYARRIGAAEVAELLAARTETIRLAALPDVAPARKATKFR